MSTHLSSVQLQALREDLREQLEQRKRHLDELREQERDSNGGEGTWQELVASAAAAERAVAELSRAFDRLAAGTYGRCTHCEAGIPFERLEIRPLARTCIDCQRRHEAA
ncbi:C4-type zinc finger protein, DksA/TraR family [[Actinomadura] parvosata subsp. kistnae]|uniref:TraR/DksA family transcriptional regulator n=1 Tax=[Actinomadura] parvosata subsp. kistnae TaxID=1909395 RepID=A0A1V0AGX0_9ACTN|nr:TraR/DksA C4-type zinc finger protein [Nonomuraea sp. ATCC 55076]AQZ69481.1 TraR/DksA family transcriptional regulator [Nonomuraea sp. ATCC 55076]SPL91870.1 C4-type zinc finger protein, DksA/TraR family [Actinomadura parvosata subsp. kistnae]